KTNSIIKFNKLLIKFEQNIKHTKNYIICKAVRSFDKL
ncbi:MAG: hypothetical protein K0S55_2089, partial [Clostridia bacterium]|nr:hypothetical protein [Clostridia bacterium]